jgi:hypothetical protein
VRSEIAVREAEIEHSEPVGDEEEDKIKTEEDTKPVKKGN